MRRISAILLVALFALPGCQGQHLPDTCYVKPSSGKCRASITRYWYDEGPRTCKAFIWGGCEGSVPFETMDACAAKCMPGQPLPEVPDAKKVVPDAAPKTEQVPAQ